MMSRGSQVVGSEMTEAIDSSSGGRSASTGRSVGSTPGSSCPTRTHTSTPSSNAARVRQSPVTVSRSQRHPVPAAQHGAVDDVAVGEAGSQVRAGARPREHRAVGVAPEHDLTTRDRAQQGAVRRHVGGGRGDEPAVGRSPQRRRQGGVDLRRLGVAPGAAQVGGRRLGEVAHRHAVAHLLAPGPVGAQQAHVTTLASRPRAGQKRPGRRDPAVEAGGPAVEVIPLAKPSTCGSNRCGAG